MSTPVAKYKQRSTKINHPRDHYSNSFSQTTWPPSIAPCPPFRMYVTAVDPLAPLSACGPFVWPSVDMLTCSPCMCLPRRVIWQHHWILTATGFNVTLKYKYMHTYVHTSCISATTCLQTTTWLRCCATSCPQTTTCLKSCATSVPRQLLV